MSTQQLKGEVQALPQPHDQSLIYKLLQRKEQTQTHQPLPSSAQKTRQNYQQQVQQKQDYGELIEVQPLQINPSGIRTDLMNLEHVQEQKMIKVFIDPNPHHAPPRQQSNRKEGSLFRPGNAQSQPSKDSERQYATLPKDKKGNFSKQPQIRIKDTSKSRQKLAKGTHRRSTPIQKDSQASRNSSVSYRQQTDSFEEFKQYKKRKKSQSLRALIKKVQGLQQKVGDLRQQNSELKQRRPIYWQQRPSTKHSQIISNLISIKVQGNGLKDDILSELRKIKEKVDVLENKSIQQSHQHRKNRTDLLQGLGQGMAQSKVQSQSRLNMSRQRQKFTGKIFRKSQVQATPITNIQQIIIQKEPSPQKQKVQISKEKIEINKESQPVKQNQQLEQVLFLQVGQILNQHNPMPADDSKQINKHQKQRKEGSPQARDAISLSKHKRKDHEQQIDDIRAQTPNEAQHRMPLQSKNEPKSQSQGGFVRSGGNRIAPIQIDGNQSRQDWEESLKMLQFDTGKEKFIVQSYHSQNQKFTLNRLKDITSYEDAQANLPNLPQITTLPTFQTDQQLLIQMGKQLLGLFVQGEIDYNNTILRVKKYKNCVFFGLDTQRNILLHYQGRLYFGGWKQYMNGEGEKAGQGFEFQHGKFVFKGQFKQGKRNGLGMLKVITNGRGTLYVGQFMEGAKHGDGKQFQQNGSYYQGEWKQNKKDGRGKLIISKNQTYQGTFVQGLKSGFGAQLFKNGDKYQGQYMFGRFQGQGVYYWSNGAIYKGEFRGGMRNGKGVWCSQKQGGDVYEGQYKDDMKHGKGVYKWANGAKYQGQFFNDQKHGKGTVTHENGKISTLQWRQGQVAKPAQEDQKEQQIFNQTKIRNYNKTLPVNRKFVPSKQREKLLSNAAAFNQLTLSNASNKIPKGFPTQKIQQQTIDQFKTERQRSTGLPQQRPVTSKSLTSVSNSTFKLQRRNDGRAKKQQGQAPRGGFPQDPPYRGIRTSANIINF